MKYLHNTPIISGGMIYNRQGPWWSPPHVYSVYNPNTLLYDVYIPTNEVQRQYFTLTALEDNCIFKIKVGLHLYYDADANMKHFWYSINEGLTWEYYDVGLDGDKSNIVIDNNDNKYGYIECLLPPINRNEHICLRTDAHFLGFISDTEYSTNVTISGNTMKLYETFSTVTRIDATEKYKVSGNILSLNRNEYFQNIQDNKILVSTNSDSLCPFLFYNSTNLIDASDLMLPGKKCISDTEAVYFGECFEFASMFEGCSNLLNAPILDFRNYNLSDRPMFFNGLYNMFKGCASLQNIYMHGFEEFYASFYACDLSAYLRDKHLDTFLNACSLFTHIYFYCVNARPANLYEWLSISNDAKLSLIAETV